MAFVLNEILSKLLKYTFVRKVFWRNEASSNRFLHRLLRDVRDALRELEGSRGQRVGRHGDCRKCRDGGKVGEGCRVSPRRHEDLWICRWNVNFQWINNDSPFDNFFYYFNEGSSLVEQLFAPPPPLCKMAKTIYWKRLFSLFFSTYIFKLRFARTESIRRPTLALHNI
jgi:hypothetical protein